MKTPRRYAPLGGGFAPVRVADFKWNGWQASAVYAVEAGEMAWSRIVDGYCERAGTDPNFWGEPLNAVTNIAFILAALWAKAHKNRKADA